MQKIDSENHHKSIFWLKGLAVLIIIMLIFTIVSRAASSFTVARVTVESVSARKIQHTVSADGQIRQNGEQAVVTEPDILIKSLEVNEGEKIEEGDLLVQLDLQDLSRKIKELQDEIQSLKLQNQALQENKDQAFQKRQTDIERAKQDYDDTVQKNETALQKAEEELQEAKEGLSKAEQALKNASPEESDEKQEIYDQCKSLVKEKESALSMALETQQAEEKEAARKLEDAKGAADSDNSIEINQISLRQLEENLAKLQVLQAQDGKIPAPKGGVVTGIFVAVGQKTTDTAMLTMSNGDAGLKFVAQISPEDAEYISVGDSITLQGIGKNTEECKITSIREDETGSSLTVMADIDTDTFSIGESAQMTVTRESKEYPYTIPVTALAQENNKMYVLLLDTENTVLGEQYTARKMEVEVLDKNNHYAALDSNSLSTDSQIIIDSDRYVEAGDKVRLMDE